MFQAIRSTMMFRFITVVAIVSALFIAAQIYQTQTSLAAGNIMMYTDNVARNGNLGGRAGADAICKGMAGKPAGFAQYRAFISVSDTDEIRDMPTLYGVPTTDPIVGTGGTIANDWADLLDGNIALELETAIGATQHYWTGSFPNGTVSFFNCLDLTSASGGNSGPIGDRTLTNSNWMMVNVLNNCNMTASLLCIAYGTAPVTAVGGVAEMIAVPTASTNGLGYLAGLAGVVMLVGAGWLVSKR